MQYSLRAVTAWCCAPGTPFEWIAMYKMDRATDEHRRAFLDRVGAAMLAW